MADIDRVEPDQRHPQPDVGLGEPITQEVGATLPEPGFEPIEGFEHLAVTGLVVGLGARGPRVVDPRVDVLTDVLVEGVNVVAQIDRIQVEVRVVRPCVELGAQVERDVGMIDWTRVDATGPAQDAAEAWAALNNGRSV